MNTSFDASKSANTLNTINYVSSAYMSAIPTHSTQGSGHGPSINNAAKLSKVNLKHGGNNSRQSGFHPQTNYSDGSTIFNNQHGAIGGRQTHSQGGINSHKTLYMSQNDRMHEIGKAYNYSGEQGLSATNIKI